MTKGQRVIVVGCGHMGLAIVQGVVGAGSGHEVVALDSSADRREVLAGIGGFSIADRLRIDEGDLVVLAIPPQAFADFAEAEGAQFGPATPVVSVMAGLTAASIAGALGTAEVLRAIPNTPSEVFQGMTAYYADAAVSDSTVERGEALLAAIGRVLRVGDEGLIDDATALCGGGPAFVSYIVDAFCRFATSRGFTEAEGRTMAVQVFAGTATLIERSGKPPMQLCREVMTPQGTTERGIASFDEAGLAESVVEALTASADRSRELASAAGSGSDT